MVLLFLRDWRSALVVVLNIPLSIMAACFALWITGQTVNIMTLSCLSLAVVVLGGHLGREIFPIIDIGQFQLRLRAPAGTRIERTEQIALQTLEAIKEEVTTDNVEITLRFVGVQPTTYPINTLYLWTAGPEE